MEEQDELIPLGVVARPHGVRGTVRVHLYNPDTHALQKNAPCLLRSEDGEISEVRILNIRKGPKAALFDFEGSNTMEIAESLRGYQVCIPRSAFPDLPEGEYYYIDLPGLGVYTGDERVGEVVEVVQYPSIDCLRIAVPGGHIELPMRAEWLLSVDVAGRRVNIADVSEWPVEPIRGDDS